MIRVVHPGSGCWLSTHPGSRGQKGTGSATLLYMYPIKSFQIIPRQKIFRNPKHWQRHRLLQEFYKKISTVSAYFILFRPNKNIFYIWETPLVKRISIYGLSVLNSFSKLNSPYTTNPYVYQRNRSFVNCHSLSLLPCQVWITVRSYQLVKMYSNSITIVAGVPLVKEVCGYENSKCIIKIFWSFFAITFCMSLNTFIKK